MTSRRPRTPRASPTDGSGRRGETPGPDARPDRARRGELGLRRERDERGAAVVDFVLVLVVLIPLVLGIAQVALVLHVRDTLAASAAEGARLAATSGSSATDGRDRTRELIDGAVSSRYARDIEMQEVTVDGLREIEVTVHATVPALGLGGPAVSLTVHGHAVEEDQ